MHFTNTTNPQQTAIREAIRDGIIRAVAIVGLAGVALIHLLDAPGTFQDAAYRGWLYVALIVSSIATAAALVRAGNWRAWAAAGALPLGAAAAFLVSRTVGLPQGANDIGNWTEPLGLASLFVEGSLVTLSAAVLIDRFGLRFPLPALRARRLAQAARA